MSPPWFSRPRAYSLEEYKERVCVRDKGGWMSSPGVFFRILKRRFKLKLWGDYNLSLAKIWICRLALCVAEIAMAAALRHARSSQIWSFGTIIRRFPNFLEQICRINTILHFTCIYPKFWFFSDFLRNSDHKLNPKWVKMANPKWFGDVRVPPCIPRLRPQDERQPKQGCPTETTR